MKEVYRDRRGRFSTYWKLWQGPHIPKDHPLAIEREREFWERQRQKVVESICAPNLLLELLRKKARIK